MQTASLSAGDLVVVDADAGAAGPSGERAGVLWRSAPDGAGGYSEPTLLLAEPTLLEPLDVVPLGEGRLLLLESLAPAGLPDAPDARGGLHRLDTRAGTLEPWFVDGRLRQPVGVARAADGTVFLSDRGADPLGQGHTGVVFVIDAAHDPARADAAPPGPAAVSLVSHPWLRAPGGLLVRADGRVLLMDADANPQAYEGTPGVLFELLRDEAGAWRLEPRLVPAETTSPLGLIEHEDGTLYLVDCNEARDPRVFADGALFRVEPDRLVKLIDVWSLGKPKVLHDPALGDTLPDGRLVVADASADPLGLGEDGSKGFMGSGPGAVLALDPAAGTVETLLASERFVTPISVRRVRR